MTPARPTTEDPLSTADLIYALRHFGATGTTPIAHLHARAADRLAEVAPLLRVLEAGVDLHVEHLPEPRYDGTKWGARSSAYGDFTFTADSPLAAIAALAEALGER